MKALAIAGDAEFVGYTYWYSGLVEWFSLNALSPPTIPVNTLAAIQAWWQNISAAIVKGHVAITLTYPDASTEELTAYENQDKEVNPDGYVGTAFQFTPTQEGIIGANIVLTDADTDVVLDSSSFVAFVVGPATQGFDINSIMALMMAGMMMAMIMRTM